MGSGKLSVLLNLQVVVSCDWSAVLSFTPGAKTQGGGGGGGGGGGSVTEACAG